MNKEELVKLGFKKCVMSDSYELTILDKLVLNAFMGEKFITMYVNNEEVELRNVNRIEKVKQLIELFK